MPTTPVPPLSARHPSATLFRSIYWSPTTGAHTVGGAIRDRWGAQNWENGALGYPVSDWTTTPNGRAQYVHFSGGSIYWSQATGARILTGAVYTAWARTASRPAHC